MRNFIFINSHPIQYFAPMYQYMNEQGLKTKVWYCSKGQLNGAMDEEFGVKIKWDIPLLDGYEYQFFRNYSLKPSNFDSFFGLINLGIVYALFREQKSVIVVHGYHFFTHFLTLLLAKIAGHKVCLRYEVPSSHEKLKNSKSQKIRRWVLKHIVFPKVNYFLYIGKGNLQLYKDYGVEDKRLVFCPYTVDNNRFIESFKKLSSEKSEIRSRIGIPIHDSVVLFSGKYIHKKRPLDLLQAFAKLGRTDCWLIMIGEGELRSEMESFIKKKNVQNVVLTGFVNQREISSYYAIGDVFVMCSSIGETWGLSVNEAMNFNLPIIVSDLTGCSLDLVDQGVNGFTYPTGDVDALASKLTDVLIEKRLSWTKSSQQLLKRFDYSTVVEELKKINS